MPDTTTANDSLLATETTATIFTWAHDPGSGNSFEGGIMIETAAPGTEFNAFPISIEGISPPEARKYERDSSGFRYWVAMEALNRGAEFWGKLLPGTTWYRKKPLQVDLDAGIALNAEYNRDSLRFFKKTIGHQTIFSCESPDVLCHEQGHAILDAIKPELWDAASIEADGFHESFGDMSALLCALQLRSVRVSVLEETSGAIYISSRLSRLAEQLAWGIRQQKPQQVEPDCLRNAVNSFFYKDPHNLPPVASATTLSSEPHSLSRVFTSAFFEGLAKMFATHEQKDEAALLGVSNDLGRILVNAVILADLVPRFFTEVALNMIAEAGELSQAYKTALKTAFEKHGLISPADTKAIASMTTKSMDRSSEAADDGPKQLVKLMLPVQDYGFGMDEIVAMVPASQPPMIKSFDKATVAHKNLADDDGSEISPEASAKSFIENLLRRGRLKMNTDNAQDMSTDQPRSKSLAGDEAPADRTTHELRYEDGQYVLRRVRIDCNPGCH